MRGKGHFFSRASDVRGRLPAPSARPASKGGMGRWVRTGQTFDFVVASLEQRLTAEQVERMHPLRRLERPPPSPEEEQEARDLGWDMFEAGLSSIRRKG